MAIANKTRWTEKWHQLGGVQVVNIKIVDGENYTEKTIMTLHPIKHVAPKPQPKMITRERINVWDLLDKLEADRAKALAK